MVAVVSIALFACKKEQMQQNEEQKNLVKVTHHYTYKDQDYTLLYYFNEKNQVVAKEGDLELDRELSSKHTSGTNLAMLVEDVNRKGTTFSVRIFDSGKEMDDYCIKTKQSSTPTEKSGPCYNTTNSGYASFYFYKHINYNTEFTNLRRTQCSFFQIHYLDVYSENDQISSLQVYSGSVDLFKDGCWYGTQIRFQESIPNLHYFTVFRDTSYDADYYGYKPSVFFPGNYNFGDMTSSIKGWSI